MPWLRDAYRVFEKDIRIERRTGEIVTTAGFFAVLIVVIGSISLSLSNAQSGGAPGVLWISVAFSAVLALGRAWHREREESALAGLLISPLSRSAIFAGKTLGVLCFLFAIEVLTIPTVALLFGVDLIKQGPGLAVIALAATPGIAATGTLFGAMTVRTRARDLILAAVLFPLMAPSLLTAVAATRELLSGTLFIDVVDHVLLLGAFDMIFVTGGLALFGPLVEG